MPKRAMKKVSDKTTKVVEKKRGRTKDGKFAPGRKKTGGRRKGVENKRTAILRELAEKESEEILRVVIDKAKSGNLDAARLILSKVMPPARSAPIELDLEGVLGLEALDRIINLTAAGKLTPDAALTMAQIIERRQNLYALDVLEKRILALENGVPFALGPIGRKEDAPKPN